MSRMTIFLDDGGVMSNNLLRGPQWQRQVAEFFVPLLGGAPEHWREANRIVAERIFEANNWQQRIQAASDFVTFDRQYQIDWLVGMCKIMGIPTPADEACYELAHRAEIHICRRVMAAYPGVIEAIRALRQQGRILHTASGEVSWGLDGYLQAMGVRACFDLLYGPDLINTLKEGPEYYLRLFAHCGIEPADAIVVDDLPRAIGWAAQCGAQTILVSPSAVSEPLATHIIKSLVDLPALIS